MQRDTLTPLDARNSLLKMAQTKPEESTTFSFAKLTTVSDSKDPISDTTRRGSSPGWYPGASPERTSSGYLQPPSQSRPLTPATPFGANQSRENLIDNAAPIDREPTIPNLGDFGESRPYQGRYGPRGYSSFRGPGGF
jgi:hypothetical protein